MTMACLFKKLLIPAFILILLFSACKKSFTPKPVGYYRINLPEKTYDTLYGEYPFTCVIASCAYFEKAENSDSNQWYNIVYPQFNAKIHLTYYKIDTTLSTYIESSRQFALQHIPKATAIKQRVITYRDHSVYGTYYNIQGSETASPVQFYLTDSTNNFLRGALYFYNTPNNDSLQPVIEYIDNDIVKLMETLKWK